MDIEFMAAGRFDKTGSYDPDRPDVSASAFQQMSGGERSLEKVITGTQEKPEPGERQEQPEPECFPDRGGGQYFRQQGTELGTLP